MFPLTPRRPATTTAIYRRAHPGSRAREQVPGTSITLLLTVGAQFTLSEGHAADAMVRDDFYALPNDLVVPTQGCHEPGIVVDDSLHLFGVHHHDYFATGRVRERLAAWLL
ncbi:MAG TPA: hypothetical protein VM146_08825 [Steroidobacteraceae bacterium]|nr:hypothetical protein [Steroidobacteraceae bacterium]